MRFSSDHGNAVVHVGHDTIELDGVKLADLLHHHGDLFVA